MYGIIEGEEYKEKSNTNEKNEDMAIQLMEDKELYIKQAKLRKKGKGWEIRYRKGNIQKSFYSSIQQDVHKKYEAWRKNILPKLLNSDSIVENNITFGEWCEQWLEVYKKPNLPIETFKTLFYTVRKHIVEPLKNYEIAKITPIILQTVLNNIVAPNAKNRCYAYLRAIFNIAQANDIIKKNPTEKLINKKYKPIGCKILTRKEQEDFKKALKGSQLEKYYLFMLYSGCRRAEALQLRLSDIDNEKNLIHIRGTKTDGSDRCIPYFDNIKELFIGHNEEEFFKFKADYVTRHFKDFCQNHILKDLRKTFSSNCHELGISPKAVQKWLGHTKISMTMNTYTDISQEFEQLEANKLSPVCSPNI